MKKLLFKVILLGTVLYAVCVASDFPFTHAVKGNLTYTLSKAANPTTDQSDAYAKITIAMDSAISFYNTYSSITRSLYIVYEPSVATADGNSNGTIRFGSNRSYMITATAMHETAHVLGIGTTTLYKNLISNGVFTGKNTTQALRKITGDSTSQVKGDAQHFWPYGLNYASEANATSEYINHVKIVDAMQNDFYPVKTVSTHSEQTKHESYLSGKLLSCNLPTESKVSLNIFTLQGKKVFKMESGILSAGTHSINLSEFPLPAGNYWYTINAGTQEFSGIFHQE